ncbi:MAG: ABC transporter permease [Acidimicrobiia bacterium]
MPRADMPRDRTGLRMADLAAEAAVGITVKPLRSILTVVGIAVGVAALVATVGLAATTTRVVSERFDDLRAREVTLVANRLEYLPSDVEERLAALPGVKVGGILGPATARARPVSATRVGPSVNVPIVAATPGGLAATRPTITGRSLDRVLPGQRVVLLGAEVAEALGVLPRTSLTTVFIDDVPFTVIGIIDRAERETSLTASAVVPLTVAVEMWPDPQATVLIDVEAGAALEVAATASLALRPDDPASLETRLMPEARRLRSDIAGELDALGLAVSATVLGVAGLAVAATMTLSVLERRREIGLHRALGARPFHIGLRFLTEATIIGTIGGVLGASSGIVVVALAGMARNATPTIPGWTPSVAVALGLAIALVAGAYPAYRAARLNPIDALRG